MTQTWNCYRGLLPLLPLILATGAPPNKFQQNLRLFYLLYLSGYKNHGTLKSYYYYDL